MDQPDAMDYPREVWADIGLNSLLFSKIRWSVTNTHPPGVRPIFRRSDTNPKPLLRAYNQSFRLRLSASQRLFANKARKVYEEPTEDGTHKLKSSELGKLCLVKVEEVLGVDQILDRGDFDAIVRLIEYRGGGEYLLDRISPLLEAGATKTAFAIQFLVSLNANKDICSGDAEVTLYKRIVPHIAKSFSLVGWSRNRFLSTRTNKLHANGDEYQCHQKHLVPI
ncbi:hypothetical protein BCR34DRAFT_335262 [Clohesyomyces aquaticus]|uniref:Uncharacterized protein n=1 Tax=Clohesyomyces aquaticus TaxID=1231657 RepID=A0A1Y1ZLJ5_9PLEO|nr:hypothetical protein BCR34DRAFT_335262 [Clohesyomyces aquaticus]